MRYIVLKYWKWRIWAYIHKYVNIEIKYWVLPSGIHNSCSAKQYIRICIISSSRFDSIRTARARKHQCCEVLSCSAPSPTPTTVRLSLCICSILFWFINQACCLDWWRSGLRKNRMPEMKDLENELFVIDYSFEENFCKIFYW